MKKTVNMIMFSALAAAMIPFRAFAAPESVNVHVTIAQEQTVADSNITVTDANGDGKLTGEDALIAAHNIFYPGGADAGFAGEDFIWGMRGSYSFMRNGIGGQDDTVVNPGYAEELKNGDSLSWALDIPAVETYYFVSEFLNRQTYSDSIAQGTELDLKLMHLIPTLPEDVPAAGVEILMDGKSTGAVTGADGKAVLKLDTVGEHTISADTSKLGYPFYYAEHVDVIPAETTVRANVIVRTSNRAEESECFAHEISIVDWDQDGKLTSDDALYQVHERYYPGGVFGGLGQDMIWGRHGEFLCEVQNAAGETVFSGAAANKKANCYELEPGCKVTFRPKDLLREEYRLTWSDGSTDTVPTYETGRELYVTAQHWLPDSAVVQMIPGVQILLDGEEIGCTTNEDGLAIVPLKQPGSHTITVKADNADAFNSLSCNITAQEVLSADAAEVSAEPAETIEAAAATAVTEAAQTTAAKKVMPSAAKAEVNGSPANAQSIPAVNENVSSASSTNGVKTGEGMPVYAIILAGLVAFIGAVMAATKRF